MPESVSLLMIEFLTWVSSRRRTYAESMEAWRSSFPRHTVWEDALADGLIQIENGDGLHQSEVILTPRGRAILDGTPSSIRPPKSARVYGELTAEQRADLVRRNTELEANPSIALTWEQIRASVETKP